MRAVGMGGLVIFGSSQGKKSTQCPPDGPMPYNDNNMLCLGINKPSYVVFHVIGVCQKGEKVGAMTMDEK